MEYAGIEFVDSATRKREHAATRVLWATLNESGLGENTIGRITAFLYLQDKGNAVELAKKFSSFGDWNVEQYRIESKMQECIRLLSPECEFTIEAFIELTDIMLIEAHKFGGEFDGFEVAADNTRKRRPWWAIWNRKSRKQI